ncbi:MAG: rhomboid family intramembrane serine protease [Phycisphaerae bacterium]|nr:rhomboid family intramembrane serine protease [Phycisphaerae bacterium]
MGLYDRHYTQDDYHSSYRERPFGRISFGHITPAVKWLLIINIAVFLLTVSPRAKDVIFYWFSVFPANLAMAAQPWRIITYQFLHADFWHLFGNMLMLFFLGPLLERTWGSKRFLVFYLFAGSVGGIAYSLFALMGVLGVGSMVGASGALLGILTACAIYFPHVRVYIWGVFPVAIRTLAIILAVWSVIKIIQNYNTGGEVAHLSGIAVALIYIFSQPLLGRLRLKSRESLWEKKMHKEQQLQAEVDRILQKVHDHGIKSLTYKEKRTLKTATTYEQMKSH